MSMEALLFALRDRLRDRLGLDEGNCEIMPTGQPPAFSGEWFYAVHPAGIQQVSDEADRMEEAYDAIVTVTRRAGFTPEDRAGTEVVAKRTTGLYAEAHKVAVAGHGIYEELMNEANAMIDEDAGTAQNGFVEPLLYRNTSRPQEKYAAWFSADEEGEGQVSGWAVEVAFGKARRVQRVVEGPIS